MKPLKERISLRDYKNNVIHDKREKFNLTFVYKMQVYRCNNFGQLFS